jgi:hypothetical protein
MMNFYVLLFTIFAVAAYFIVTDESVAAAFYYISRLAKSYIDRQMVVVDAQSCQSCGKIYYIQSFSENGR